MYSIIAVTALLASSAVAASVGEATVINGCSYDVLLANVPSQGGGYDEIDKTLSAGDSYTQTWTELTNGNGWSIKLSKDESFADIMQYEYTFHNDGIIWYDLSDVNGNPWDGNWEITAESPDSTCSPKQQAYRYSTDDAYGMQSCPQDSVITVTLCSGESQNDGGAASASSSVAAASTASVESTYSSPTSTPPPPPVETSTSTEAPASTEPATSAASSTSSTYSGPHRSWWKNNKQVEATPSATTFATLTSSTITTTAAAGVTVTQVDTAVVTEVVTAYGKRHAHHRRHGRA